MTPSPSSIQRAADSDAKTSMANDLLAEIVPMLHDLDAQGLKEVHAYLEAKLQTERRETEKLVKKDK